ncbi:hypothetical protein DH2020_000958 [Rehmannia glutinosa]|uniref:Saccharopine dehydrogenase NADP binding domain-containing protein n=1 Tax=Rehmannia glutinosa TaxID=99300 RepID=A0ABR0XYA5_REHGL
MSNLVCMGLNFGGFVRASAESREINGDFERVRLPENVRKSRVLIVGGAGAAGRNTAFALSKFCPELQIVIGGRNRDRGGRVVERLGNNSEFVHVDIEDVNSIEAALTDVDLVVHAAGPFEYADSKLLEAAIQTKTAYIDICDHEGYARHAKSFKDKAIAAGIPAITNGGANPGDNEDISTMKILLCIDYNNAFFGSSVNTFYLVTVMAATLVHNAERESRGQPERLRFHYFTAGSGGTGPGVLATSFYLMADEVVTYHEGSKMKVSPYSDMLRIDFGEGVGRQEVFLMNVPEMASAHEVFGVPTISARFGTAPFFWNWTLSAMIKLLPTGILKDKNAVKWLVRISYPLIRAVDKISGETAAIKVRW